MSENITELELAKEFVKTVTGRDCINPVILYRESPDGSGTTQFELYATLGELLKADETVEKAPEKEQAPLRGLDALFGPSEKIKLKSDSEIRKMSARDAKQYLTDHFFPGMQYENLKRIDKMKIVGTWGAIRKKQNWKHNGE